MSDKKIRKFISNLDKAISNPISKVTYFSTHEMRWRERFIKGMKKTLKNCQYIDEVCPEFLEVRMQTNQGPAVQGSDVKIKEFISTLKEFMK